MYKRIYREEVKYQEYIVEPEVEIDNFDNFNDEIIDEINFARQYPEKYVNKLETILSRLGSKNDNSLFIENVVYSFNDLYGSLVDSIEFLKSQKKLPELVFNEGLLNSSYHLLQELLDKPKYINTNRAFEQRLKNYGEPFGENYEIVNNDVFDPEFLVIKLILGDGDKDKFSRGVIFNPNLKYIGVDSGIYGPLTYIIINISEDFYEDIEKIPNEVKNKYKNKKNVYLTKTIDSKKGKSFEPKIKEINWDKVIANIKKKNKKNKINKIEDNNKNKNIKNEQKKKFIEEQSYNSNLEKIDEEEFFEKEFRTNYGQIEKDKNSYKKLFSTTSTDNKGIVRTINTELIENVAQNGIKRGYFIEKEEKNGNKYIIRNAKEEKDLNILKDLEGNEMRRFEGEVPPELQDGVISIKISKKEKKDLKNVQVLEITKTITYKDGTVKNVVEYQPLN